VRPASASGLVAVLRQQAAEDPDANEPQGEAVPPAERATIGDLVALWSSCLASGNTRSLLGLFTADGVRRLLGERSPYIGGPAGLHVAVLGVSDVVRMPDGRIAGNILVDPSGNGTAAPETLLIVAAQDQDGAWRIDELRPLEGSLGGAGQATGGPQPAVRPLLRQPIAPGPDVPLPAPGPTVPMRGADAARSGNQPGPIPATEPSERWRAPTGWHSDAQPIVTQGLVCFGGFSLGDRTALLSAVDAASGGIRWQTTAPVAWAEFPDTPALASDTLFAPVQAPVAGILAVSAGNGQPLWFAPFGFTSVTAPAVDAATVYVAGWGVRNARDRTQNDTVGAVFALDQRTGRERWRFLAPVLFGPVAVGRGSIFVPSDHGLYSLDAATGRKRWQARFAPDSQGTATVVGSIVAFAGSEITSGERGIFDLDASSGALLWREELPAVAGLQAGTAATNDTLYVTWWDAPEGELGRGVPTLRAYDLASGAERWVYRADNGPQGEGDGVGSITEPVIAGDSVVFGVSIRAPAPGDEATFNGIYAINAKTGALRWHTSAGTPIDSTPAVLDGTIYAMGGLRPRGDAAGGNLIAFSAD
jgi:outer membrane protein assembly factor BamB